MSEWILMREKAVNLQVEGSGVKVSSSLTGQLHTAVGQTAFAGVYHFLCETKL